MKLFSAEKYRGKRVCVALSGGVDSVCLLHAFKAQASDMGITLSAVHIEHGIRGEESLRDMFFCEKLCKSWEIPLKVVRADVVSLAKRRGSSIEETARFLPFCKRMKPISSRRRTMRMTPPRPFSFVWHAGRALGACGRSRSTAAS